MANYFEALDLLSAFFLRLVDLIQSEKFWIGLGAAAIIFVVFLIIFMRRRYGVAQIALNLPFGLGNITYETTEQDRTLAWKMYVQLRTRIAALPFDENLDVIADVYESLHTIFAITREVLSEAKPFRAQSQRSIVDFILRVLNDGIRPKLTRWQAHFLYWWDKAVELPENTTKTPQEIQRTFPGYNELIEDLKKMNTELFKYAEDLLAIVHAPKVAGKVKALEHPIPIKPHVQ